MPRRRTSPAYAPSARLKTQWSAAQRPAPSRPATERSLYSVNKNPLSEFDGGLQNNKRAPDQIRCSFAFLVFPPCPHRIGCLATGPARCLEVGASRLPQIVSG